MSVIVKDPLRSIFSLGTNNIPSISQLIIKKGGTDSFYKYTYN